MCGPIPVLVYNSNGIPVAHVSLCAVPVALQCNLAKDPLN